MDTRIKERTIKWKQTIIFSMFVLLAAQINFDIFTTYFRVSLGIIMIPILIFLFQRIPLLPVTVLSGIGVWLSRALFSGGAEWICRTGVVELFSGISFLPGVWLSCLVLFPEEGL